MSNTSLEVPILSAIGRLDWTWLCFLGVEANATVLMLTILDVDVIPNI
jgi:hypothetical protein